MYIENQAVTKKFLPALQQLEHSTLEILAEHFKYETLQGNFKGLHAGYGLKYAGQARVESA
jgi:hypothetical protein